MKDNHVNPLAAALLLLLTGMPGLAGAAALVQCPGDTNGDAIVDSTAPKYNDVSCMHLGAGDGFVTMADVTTIELMILGLYPPVPGGDKSGDLKCEKKLMQNSDHILFPVSRR